PSLWRLDDPWIRSTIHIFREDGGTHFDELGRPSKWVEITDEILEPDPLTNERPEGCLSGWALIADFNADRVPDVFMHCAADGLPDAPDWRDRREFPRILLSQPNGKLKLELVLLREPVWAYSATA